MQKENKNEEETVSPEEKTFDKIDYTIQTMDSDLKRKSPKENSLELSVLKEKKVQKEEKKEIPIKKTEEKIQPKKNFNPFLDDLQPIEKFEPEPQKPESGKNSELIKKDENAIPSSQKNELGLKDKAPVVSESFEKNTPPVVEKNLKVKKNNGFLLIFLFTLSLVTVGSGFYYYYFHLNPSKPEEITQEKLVEEQPVVEEPIPEQIFSEKLQTSQALVLEENSSLTALVKNQKENLSLSVNEYYQIKQVSKNLNSSEILSLLDIKLPEEALDNLGEAWIMAYNQEDVLKMNLILEINQDSEKISEVLTNNEYRLPQLLKPLFIDEDFVLQDEEIVFKDSVVLNGIRYYNLVEGFGDKAIDWGIVDDKYLIFATSKKTADILTGEL